MEEPVPMTEEPVPICASDFREYERISDSPEPAIKTEPEYDATTSNQLLEIPQFVLPIRAARSFEQPAPIQRALGKNRDGNFEEAPTACWESHRDEPYRHLLMCNHQTITPNSQPCGSNCRTSSKAESKPFGTRIACKVCDPIRKKVFMPRKRKAPVEETKTKATAQKPTPLFVEPEHADGVPAGLRTSKRLKNNSARAVPVDGQEKATIELNKQIAQDPALQKLVAAATGPGIRSISQYHPGLALPQELETKANSAKLDREIKKLHVNGTDALLYRGRRGYRAADDPSFAIPDSARGERPKDMYPDERVAMAQQEEDFEAETEKLILDEYGERYCICQGFADEDLVPCEGCDGFFHPSCLGKEHPGYHTRSNEDIGGPRFLCHDCEEVRETNQALADEIMSQKAAKEDYAQKRAATIKKREDAKKLLEQQKMRELFGDDLAELNAQDALADHNLGKPASREQGEAEGSIKPDVEMTGT